MARRGFDWVLVLAVAAWGCGGGSGGAFHGAGRPAGGIPARAARRRHRRRRPPPTVTPPPPPPPPTTTAEFKFGTQGPWAVENVAYGSKDGVQETPVVGLSTDESQNRWLATPRALYLLRPGETTFRRFDERDGLHMGQNRAHYCNDRPIPVDQRCTSDESWGVAAPEGINVIVGGGPDEVFVGYHAVHPSGFDCGANGNGEDWCDPDRHSGKIDRVRLQADGTLKVDRFDLVANAHGGRYWHDREILRLAFDHFARPHTLYTGTEHGVTLLFPDKYRLPNPGEWYDLAYQEWMGDHLHARVCLDRPCDATSSNQKMGDWRGLAIDAEGGLWHAGKWSAGLISWDPSPLNWWQRQGAAFEYAFGDPYYPDGSGSPPVFRVANEGHVVALTAAAVCPDGKVWFGSSGPADGVVRDGGLVRRKALRLLQRAGDGARRGRGAGPRLPARRPAGAGRLLDRARAVRPGHRQLEADPRRRRHPERPDHRARGGPDAHPAHAPRLDRSRGRSAARPAVSGDR